MLPKVISLVIKEYLVNLFLRKYLYNIIHESRMSKIKNTQMIFLLKC